IATVDPWAGIGEIVGEGVFVIALFAYDNPARARHGEGGVMLQAMNFDYICKHVRVGGRSWGWRIREGQKLFSYSPFPIPNSPFPTRITFSPPRPGLRAGRKREPGGGDNRLTRECLPLRPPPRRRRGLRPR